MKNRNEDLVITEWDENGDPILETTRNGEIDRPVICYYNEISSNYKSDKKVIDKIITDFGLIKKNDESIDEFLYRLPDYVVDAIGKEYFDVKNADHTDNDGLVDCPAEPAPEIKGNLKESVSPSKVESDLKKFSDDFEYAGDHHVADENDREVVLFSTTNDEAGNKALEYLKKTYGDKSIYEAGHNDEYDSYDIFVYSDSLENFKESIKLDPSEIEIDLKDFSEDFKSSDDTSNDEKYLVFSTFDKNARDGAIEYLKVRYGEDGITGGETDDGRYTVIMKSEVMDDSLDFSDSDTNDPETLEGQGWVKVDQKDVYDDDGFRDIYYWYKNPESGLHRFYFSSDVDYGDPDYYDWESESEETAKEWFDSYGKDELEESRKRMESKLLGRHKDDDDEDEDDLDESKNLKESIASDIVKEIKKAYPEVQIHQESESDKRRNNATKLTFVNYPGQFDKDSSKTDRWKSFLKHLDDKYENNETIIFTSPSLFEIYTSPTRNDSMNDSISLDESRNYDFKDLFWWIYGSEDPLNLGVEFPKTISLIEDKFGDIIWEDDEAEGDPDELSQEQREEILDSARKEALSWRNADLYDMPARYTNTLTVYKGLKTLLGIDCDKLDESLKKEKSEITESSDTFDRSKTGMSFYDAFVSDKMLGDNYSLKDYYRFEKGLEGRIVDMTADDYLSQVSEFWGSSVDQIRKQYNGEHSKEKIDKYAEDIKSGNKYHMPVLNFAEESQEGNHRMLAAEKVYGEKEKFPVLVVELADPTDEEIEKYSISKWGEKGKDWGIEYVKGCLESAKERFSDKKYK